MLHDKRKDLTSEKQKKLLQRLVSELSHAQPNLYYLPTSEIAAQIKRYAENEAGLINDEKDLLMGLSQRDVEVLLSLH